jgi:hypothetical protein
MKTMILVLFTIMIAAGIVFAQDQEEITLTTYYPAPYGDYENLKSNRLAVGSGAMMPANKGDANIEGNLSVNGTVSIGPYTLPSTDGNVGDALTTDGNGTTTWASSILPAGMIAV